MVKVTLPAKTKTVITCKPIDVDNTPIRFGKYKGKTPNEVAKVDPKYIVWMWNEVTDPPVTKELALDCEHAVTDHDADEDDEQERSCRDEYQYGRD